MAQNFGYAVVRSGSELDVHVFDADGRNRLAKFNWCIRDGGDQWGSPHMEIGRIYDTAGLEDILNFVGRFRKAADQFILNPAEFFEVMGKMRGVTRVVYDPRVSKAIPFDAVMPLDLVTYMDDYEAIGEKYCSVHAHTKTADEARAYMLLNWPSGKDDSKAAWLSAGCPVKLAYNYAAPDPDNLRTIEEMIAL